jgi:hypothetical protein
MRIPWEHLRRLADEDLYALADALDAEVQRRADRQRERGYQRSTYLADQVRGERLAPRRRLAA